MPIIFVSLARKTTLTKNLKKMKYYEATFRITPWSETSSDVLSALLADCGFEAFETTDSGLKGYVQRPLWNQSSVEEMIAQFPMPVNIKYQLSEADYANWNQDWEEEGFEPIVIGRQICVHDTRHPAPVVAEHDILINPRMAFGSGTHPTTQMMMHALLQEELTGKSVMDAGCGTGVLGILAMQCGAKDVVAYDIDEWSTKNATENFSHNGFDNERILLGDARTIEDERGIDLVMANINRNILLADLPTWRRTLREGGELLLSGFYEADVPLIVEAAAKLGLKKKGEMENGDWRLIRLG